TGSPSGSDGRQRAAPPTRGSVRSPDPRGLVVSLVGMRERNPQPRHLIRRDAELRELKPSLRRVAELPAEHRVLEQGRPRQQLPLGLLQVPSRREIAQRRPQRRRLPSPRLTRRRVLLAQDRLERRLLHLLHLHDAEASGRVVAAGAGRRVLRGRAMSGHVSPRHVHVDLRLREAFVSSDRVADPVSRPEVLRRVIGLVVPGLAADVIEGREAVGEIVGLGVGRLAAELADVPVALIDLATDAGSHEGVLRLVAAPPGAEARRTTERSSRANECLAAPPAVAGNEADTGRTGRRDGEPAGRVPALPLAPTLGNGVLVPADLASRQSALRPAVAAVALLQGEVPALLPVEVIDRVAVRRVVQAIRAVLGAGASLRALVPELIPAPAASVNVGSRELLRPGYAPRSM